MKITTMLAAILLVATCGFAPALSAPLPPNCMVNEEAAAQNLMTQHGEVLAYAAIAAIRGGRHSAAPHVMQIYVNPETLTWTGILVHPSSEGGRACQAGSGYAWLRITHAVGDPA